LRATVSAAPPLRHLSFTIYHLSLSFQKGGNMKSFIFVKFLLLLACALAVASFVTSKHIFVLISAALVLIAFMALIAAESDNQYHKSENARPEFEKPEPSYYKPPQSKQGSPLHAYAVKSDAAAEPQKTPPPAAAPAPLSSDELNSEKIAVLNKFASVASHDLKNPLSSMKNIAYYFTHSVKIDGEVPNKMLKMLGSEVDRMNSMIVDLLDVTRVKQLNPSVSDLDVLINEAVEKEKTPAFSFELNLEKLRVNVDPERFKQVIKNLIDNAKDAMPDGGNIKVRAFKANKYAITEITDSGKGMDKATLDKCFDPMFTTKTAKALGMSLTVSKQIVTMSGGSIRAESELGSGSKFIIKLPLVL